MQDQGNLPEALQVPLQIVVFACTTSQRKSQMKKNQKFWSHRFIHLLGVQIHFHFLPNFIPLCHLGFFYSIYNPTYCNFNSGFDLKDIGFAG